MSLPVLSFSSSISTNAHAQRGRGGAAAPADGGPNGLGALHFRPLGPEGNRVASITGVPGDAMTVYIGAADGGIWKTSDAGINWRPVFDDKDVSAVGALAVAPSAHDTVWAGTGEPWLIRPYYTLGDGVYKSIDAGRTWQHMGLDATGHIARILIDPADANNVFVCAIGQAFRAQHERGVFHSTDGGATWQQALAVDDNTGCSDLAMDPRDSKTLYAGMWQLIIHRGDLHSGGPGSGVYVTHDGGTTWSRITGHGLPAADHALGKTAVAVAPSNPERVYALVQDAPAPGLYRSNDRGATWQLVNQSHMPAERAPYYTRMVVSPDDENLLYFPSVAFTMSRDGGTTVFQAGAAGRGAPGAGGRGQGAPAAAGRGQGAPATPAENKAALAAAAGEALETAKSGCNFRAGWRQSRRLDRSDQRQPRARRQRCRRRDQRQPRRVLPALPAADLAGLSRDGGQRGPLQRDGQHPGQVELPRAEPRRRRRSRRHGRRQLGRHRRLRGCVRGARPRRSRTSSGPAATTDASSGWTTRTAWRAT